MKTYLLLTQHGSNENTLWFETELEATNTAFNLSILPLTNWQCLIQVLPYTVRHLQSWGTRQ